MLFLDAVSHAYGHLPGQLLTVDRLTLSLHDGEIGCLLGASGCGKTTVLRLIAGFETPMQGSITLQGETVATPFRSVPPEKRRIGMVFQDYALFPHLTVAANVAFGLRTKGAPLHSRVSELLELVGLGQLGKKYPHELSGGQQQRVALARALAPQPHLLLLDEPFSNLDAELREHLSLEVRAILKKTGTAALLVTHDQHEAFAVADRIGFMRSGRIEQWDTPCELYHRPATRHVARFIGQGVFLAAQGIDENRMATELGALQGTVITECEGNHCSRHPPGAVLDVLLRPHDVVHDDQAPDRAEIIGKAFRGAEFLYTLRLDSGAKLLALAPSHHDHAIGERIGIRLATDHAIAFHAPPDQPPVSASL